MAGVFAFLAFVGVMVLFLQGVNMAKLTEVQASLDAQSTKIDALAARIPGPSAADETQLEGLKQQIDANNVRIDALAPAPAV